MFIKLSANQSVQSAGMAVVRGAIDLKIIIYRGKSLDKKAIG